MSPTHPKSAACSTASGWPVQARPIAPSAMKGGRGETGPAARDGANDLDSEPAITQNQAPLRLLCRECAVLEGEPVATPAAVNRIACLHVVGKRQYVIAGRAAYSIGERRRPSLAVPPQAKGVAGTVRALHEVSGLRSLGHRHDLATVRTADGRHGQIPSSRLRRPRSKPTTTSSSTVITGTAIRPVLATSSSRAPASSATFFAANGMP